MPITSASITMPTMSPDSSKKPVDHLVTFSWKPGTPKSVMDAAMKAIADLVHGFPNVTAYVGGMQRSTESPGNGWHYGFRITFTDIDALGVYVHDQHHHAVVDEYIKPYLAETGTVIVPDGTVVFDILHD